MDYDIREILFYTGLITFMLFSLFKERKRNQLHNETTAKISNLENITLSLREDVDLVARNPQLARRKLKSKDTIL